MDAITYSLKYEGNGSQEYYQTVRHYTDELLIKAKDTLMPMVREFKHYLMEFRLEELREDEEYLLELISFGVLWRQYAPVALRVQHAPFITLSRMAEWRKKHQRLKPYIDLARGILTTMFLLPPVEEERAELPTLEQIDQVCQWFEATGEFKEQALRFVLWRAFWQSKSPDELRRIFAVIHSFTKYFEESSLEALGKYTLNVEPFLVLKAKHYRWREDRISCMRSRLEYHLNMAGAELMNRAFRREFLDTDVKVLLLPGCMRGRSEDECKARRVAEGLRCEGCMAGCGVNRLREMGLRYGFEVYIIPHASDLSLWSPHKGISGRGVVASACLTHLVEGGWELKRYDVPAQCVVLDSCGCKKHWHQEGIPTELNLTELKRILS